MENSLIDQKDFTTTIFNNYVIFKFNLKKVYNKVDEERIIK
jgi:hypothetical protein